MFTGAGKPDAGRSRGNWTRQFGTSVWHRGDTSIVLVYHLEQVKLSGYERSSLGGAGVGVGKGPIYGKVTRGICGPY